MEKAKISLKSELHSQQAAHGHSKDELDQTKTLMRALDDELRDRKADLEAGHERVDLLQKQIEELTSGRAVLHEQHASVTRERDELAQQLRASRSLKEQDEQSTNAIRENLAASETANKDIQARFDAILAEHDALAEKNRELTSSLDLIGTHLDMAKLEVSESHEFNAALRNKIQELEAGHNESQEMHDAMIKRNEELAESVNQLSEQLDAVESKGVEGEKAMQDSLHALEHEREQLFARNVELQTAIADIQKDFAASTTSDAEAETLKTELETVLTRNRDMALSLTDAMRATANARAEHEGTDQAWSEKHNALVAVHEDLREAHEATKQNLSEAQDEALSAQEQLDSLSKEFEDKLATLERSKSFNEPLTKRMSRDVQDLKAFDELHNENRDNLALIARLKAQNAKQMSDTQKQLKDLEATNGMFRKEADRLRQVAHQSQNQHSQDEAATRQRDAEIERLKRLGSSTTQAFQSELNELRASEADLRDIILSLQSENAKLKQPAPSVTPTSRSYTTAHEGPSGITADSEDNTFWVKRRSDTTDTTRIGTGYSTSSMKAYKILGAEAAVGRYSDADADLKKKLWELWEDQRAEMRRRASRDVLRKPSMEMMNAAGRFRNKLHRKEWKKDPKSVPGRRMSMFKRFRSSEASAEASR